MPILYFGYHGVMDGKDAGIKDIQLELSGMVHSLDYDY